VQDWIVSYWPLVTQIVLGVLLFACTWIYLPLLWGALWLPAPRRVVKKMLRLAGVQPGQMVVDLGAGDGRIVIAAARRFKAQAIGVEIDPLRCLIANAEIRLHGLRARARVRYGNMFEFDLAGADVVTLYLWPKTHQRLRARLIEQLRLGARVVCYRFPIYGWTPVAGSEIAGGNRAGSGRADPEIFVYEIGKSDPNLRAMLSEAETETPSRER
jgi:SAM-dependent methyltransferase